MPDNAFLFEDDKEVIIYEKKFQQCNGSADEKPQTCAFKIMQYKKLFSSLGIEKVSYIYIFNDWFENQMYKDMLDYIKSQGEYASRIVGYRQAVRHRTWECRLNVRPKM